MGISKKFDYTFLKNNVEMAKNMTLAINIFSWMQKDLDRKNKFPKIYLELQKQAKFESVKSSNAIEGIVSTDKIIKSIVELKTEPNGHTELEIAGYRDALDYINQNYDSLDLSKNTILKLHELMLIKAKPWIAGKYKTTDNVVAEIKPDGQKKIRFIPLPHNEVEIAMDQMIEAYHIANSDECINKLFLIHAFVLDFLCIHPFDDGNGRISRLLTLLLLYKNGIDIGKYVSIEQGIEIDKYNYYESLRLSSIDWDINQNNAWHFIYHQNLVIARCYRYLDDLFKNVTSKKGNKSQRIELLVTNCLFPISKTQISKLLPDISISTIEAVLSNLLKDGKIEKVGKTKSVQYRGIFKK